jgi:hypothetical protein
MEASTTIRKMILGNKIIVPTYQRAYAWETPTEKSQRKTHTDVFLSDLDEYQKSDASTPYYFGHFLFEEKSGSKFHVIDGQQRLTTISIYISALFARLEAIRELSESEREYFEDMVKRGGTYRFSTVEYDDQLFKDYVIDQTKKDKNGLETESSKRIVCAFDFFKKQLANKEASYVTRMLEIIEKATCTTHQVMNESEAVQMFIFQNNRGKKPSDLEVIKAQFMYNVHLYGGEEKDSLIVELKNRFEKIYKTISKIDYKIDEDDALLYTLRVYLNSLTVSGAQEVINKELSREAPIPFIKAFSQLLADSFENLNTFFKDEKTNHAIHSLVSLGGIGITLPFIIKAYSFDLDVNTIGQLCMSLESLVLRQRLIGTRAELTTRIDGVFGEFTNGKKSIQEIVDQVNMMKVTEGDWWSYWNNNELGRVIQGGLNHSVAKFLLWKYENSLKDLSEKGYGFFRFYQIEKMELEHIAPSTEPKEKPHGYDEYDEEFVSKYLNCLGNYLITSKSHNASIRNDPFPLKHKRFTELKQQTEVQELGKDGIWNRVIIQARKEKIIQFVMATF